MLLGCEISLYGEASGIDCCMQLCISVSYQFLPCSTFCSSSIQTPSCIFSCSSFILKQATCSITSKLYLKAVAITVLGRKFPSGISTCVSEKYHVLQPSEFIYSFTHSSLGFSSFMAQTVFLCPDRKSVV